MPICCHHVGGREHSSISYSCLCIKDNLGIVHGLLTFKWFWYWLWDSLVLDVDPNILSDREVIIWYLAKTKKYLVNLNLGDRIWCNQHFKIYWPNTIYRFVFSLWNVSHAIFRNCRRKNIKKSHCLYYLNCPWQ